MHERSVIRICAILLIACLIPGCSRMWDPEQRLVDAVHDGDEAEVKRLLAHGADPNATGDISGFSVLGSAATHGHERIVAALLEAGADVNFGGPDPPGFPSPLREAASFGHARVVEQLLDAGAKMDPVALGMPAFNGDAQTVRVFLDHGVDPDPRDPDGNTPLMSAAFNGHREVAEMLIAAGATPSLRNDAGNTAADQAREEGHEELANWLEEQTASVAE